MDKAGHHTCPAIGKFKWIARLTHVLQTLTITHMGVPAGSFLAPACMYILAGRCTVVMPVARNLLGLLGSLRVIVGES
jgi:cytochrome b subunit of formate dehydrogenase